MKNTNIVLTVFLVATLFGATLAAAAVGDIISSDADIANAASVAASITATDAIETEIEVENEIEFETSTKSTVSKGQGWIVTGGKGALLEILFVTKEGTTADGVEASVTAGWLRAGNLKLKLDSTSSTDASKTFTVTGGDGSVTGTLTLAKQEQVFQTGFGVWNGDLKLKVGDKPFDAKVTVAIEEKQSGKGASSGNNRGSGSSTSTSNTIGYLELGGLGYNLEGSSNKAQKLEFKVIGADGDSVGELKLESRDLKTYTGKIEIKTDSDESQIKGEVSATLNREGNTLYGPIRVELDGSAATDLASLEGVIKIALSENSASDDSKDKDRKVDSKSDSSESKSSEDVQSDRGFWKRFASFFGGN